MRGVCVLFIVELCLRWTSSQFLNHRPFPTYSLEHMPDTEFSCRDKILGGYYADAETECQMFHICVKVAGVGVQDYRFLCPNGTAFDQDHQICAEWEDVDCDATTLYYSSDNFDLYRIGSGYESKALKYGEDEETFALQRAETGDVRLNREHQVQRVNQQKDNLKQHNKNNRVKQQQDNAQERDIFKGSSSSNFFNNRNNGKENDEDYDDDNVNFNQDRDNYQRKKIIRKQNRRPANQQNNYRPSEPNKNIEQPRANSHPRNRNQNNNNYNNNNSNNNNNGYNQEQHDTQTSRPRPNNSYNQEHHDTQTSRPRPTGFRNNFAGSSYIPTTLRPSSTTIDTEQYTKAINHYRLRNGHQAAEKKYNNAENFRQTQDSNSPTPTYKVSTPAPFKETQQYNNAPRSQQNNNNNGQYNPTTLPPKKFTDNYPTTTTPQPNSPTEAPVRNTQSYNPHYDVPKTKQTENYPSTPITKQTESYFTNTNKQSIPHKQTENYPENNPKYNSNFDRKPTTPVKQTENYPITSAPKTKNDYPPTQYTNNQKSSDNLPTTFAPRTNAGYTQISQQTTQYRNANQQNYNSQSTQNFSPPARTNQYSNQPSSAATFKQQNSTPKSSPFTQYTPTVPKITSTTPVSRTVPRSNRFDETQYDDGSYDDTKYNYKEEESLRPAQSQNIASSRNEYINNNNRPTKPQVTQKPYHESPRPFSVSPNTPKVTEQPKSSTKTVQKPVENKRPAVTELTKKDYDYAYYDTSVGSEPEYEIDADIKKSTVKN